MKSVDFRCFVFVSSTAVPFEIDSEHILHSAPKDCDNTTCPDDAPACQEFNVPLMCNGHHRDYNYLYTCKNLLLGSFSRVRGQIASFTGVLHSPPSDVRPQLLPLLHQCLYPTRPMMRSEAFHGIIRLLEDQPAQVMQMPADSRWALENPES